MQAASFSLSMPYRKKVSRLWRWRMLIFAFALHSCGPNTTS